MNLPLVVDIALGLIFIYLTLSLLASEIQELITTVLQWRAEHLKKSIDILLTGDNYDNPDFQKFTNELYNSPLIRSLNQEAKGVFARFFRRITHGVGRIFRTFSRTDNHFRSGPSYIPSESFAVALLQKLDIETLSQKISELTLIKFGEEKLNQLQDVINDLRNSVGDDKLLDYELSSLKQNLGELIRDFISQRITFSMAVDHMTTQFSRFVDNTETLLADNDHCRELVRRRLPYLRQILLLKRLEPTIAEVISMVIDKDQTLPPQVAAIINKIRQDNSNIPDTLKLNLVALAKQAQLKAQGLDEGVRQLQKEVETWFDRSMERASGVYRRNAKGIAIVIGFVIAVLANADSLHIVNRLSKDTTLRSAISAAADQVVDRSISSSNLPGTITPDVQDAPPITPTTPSDPTQAADSNAVTSPNSEAIQQDLEAVRNAVDNALQGISLPLGWNTATLQQQALEEQQWSVPYVPRLLGWALTGIAISMGSSFWFDLLSKIVRVRNSGTSTQSRDSD